MGTHFFFFFFFFNRKKDAKINRNGFQTDGNKNPENKNPENDNHGSQSGFRNCSGNKTVSLFPLPQTRFGLVEGNTYLQQTAVDKVAYLRQL